MNVNLKGSYYHDGQTLPTVLTIPEEQLPGATGSAARLVAHTAMETMRAVGAAPSPEFRDVYDFHRKFDLMASVQPRHLTRRKLKERVEFLLEELQEFASASGIEINVSYINVIRESDDQDLAGQADALVDLVYVALGTAVMLGLPWDVLWADVQRANMAKVRKVTHRGHQVDVGKPEGWVGPRTGEILAAAGYEISDWLVHNGSGCVDEAKCHDDV